MMIKYEFVNGEEVEIEVDEKWGNILMEMDRQERNNNHKEKRRHLSYDTDPEAREWLADENLDPANIYEEKLEEKKIDQAFNQLSDKQQKLVWDLYELNREVEEVAREEGVDHSAISHRMGTVKKKIKKYF